MNTAQTVLTTGRLVQVNRDLTPWLIGGFVVILALWFVARRKD